MPLVATIAHSVCTNGLEACRKGVVATRHGEHPRVLLAVVVPFREAVAFGGSGHEGHRVAERVHAVASGCASRRGTSGVDGHRAAHTEHVVGAYVEHGGVRHVEGIGGVAACAAGGGVQGAEGIVAVAVAAPAPVEMEHIVVVIAVAHKAVATRGVASVIQNRPLQAQLGTQHGTVRGGVIAARGQHHNVGSILEVIHQGAHRRRVVGAVVEGAAATLGADIIIHLYSHSHVVHQLRHSVDLGLAARTVQFVGHDAPVIVCGAEIGILRAIAYVAVACHIAVAAIAGGGVVPIFHDLRRCRSHTAGHHILSVYRVVGAHGVVVGALVPRGGEQRGNLRGQARLRSHAAEQPRPLFFHSTLRAVGIPIRTLYPVTFNLILIPLEPAAQVRRHILGSEGSGERVGQYGTRTVVGGHQHKALGRIENIETAERRSHLLQFRNRAMALGRHKVRGNPARSVHIDGLGRSSEKRRHRKQQYYYILSHKTHI